MFTWYRNAEYCLVYLQDVEGSGLDAVSRSAWFSRGWTLQELLAPATVLFYDRSWNIVGAKGSLDIRARKLIRTLHAQITQITAIPDDVLCDVSSANRLEVKDRLEWAAKRKTTRPEDMAYSLLGIFGVYMAPIYGEGYRHAYRRLLREIKERHDDILEPRGQEHDRPSSQREQGPSSICDILYLGKVIVRGRFNPAKIPRSEFKWHDDLGRPYTVVLRENVFTEVLENGSIGLEVASRSLDPREHRMRAMWKEHGRVMEADTFVDDVPPSSAQPPGVFINLPTPSRENNRTPNSFSEDEIPQTQPNMEISPRRTANKTNEAVRRTADHPIRMRLVQKESERVERPPDRIKKQSDFSRLFSRLKDGRSNGKGRVVNSADG